ncbi:ArsB/NhaD family transporter [Dissulfurirhabdus thermomarina]|uniref:ArsB/NhaD family transporter n=2 Tax=Dissulfurirhabdus thermomarina TaxID=1765737 RepID=A0A6N9TPK1_DISTH|nr:ArsB/NhaD family transporter [Dissulfurirhabdus thermomarina]NMX23048.1 ArsB/NhaD family transporter [Dissulfurirhabdus thermomarina]
MLCLAVAAFSAVQAAAATEPAAGAALEHLYLTGRVLDNHKEPVADAELQVLVNGEVQPVREGKHREAMDAFTTASDGSYHVVFGLPPGTLETARVELAVYKPSFARLKVPLSFEDMAVRGPDYYHALDIQLERTLGPAFWIATCIFLLAYILISFELLHRTLAAMLGAALMLLISYTLGTLDPDYHILSYERAVHAIDMNVVFLLMGMMIIVGILKNTGVFQWCAYKSYQLARGNVLALSSILMAFTAFASAFLDNVTTMLLLTPVTIEIALSLGISPLALLVPEILASNIGGTATLIGDPPNIMIGSYAGLTFMDFVVNLAPTVVASMVVLFVYSKFAYGGDYARARVEDVPAFIEKLREEYRITDRSLLTVGLIVMGITVAFFLTHGFWHMEVSIAALFGASVLFTYGIATKRVDLLKLIEKDIEWATLLFFIFLFILVGAVEETGLLALISDWVLRLSEGNLVAAICLILWVSAIMSAFVDNIPFTATMLPIVAYLTRVIPGADSGVLWWALAFGACFGGNGTMIGASANVVTLGIAEAAGHPVRFFQFMKVAFLYMVLSVGLANVWLLLFY